jgi:hypothetical protein
MIAVLFFAFAKDEYVVNVDDHELIEKRTENIVHEVPEGCGGVSEAKRHNKIFIMSDVVLNAVFSSSPSAMRI